MPKQPLLSIGLIVKNEIRCLERCLKSLEPLRQAIPCQVVVADTGSTDGTRAVAERYADVLFDFPWTGSFADARNAVLDRCTGVWYLTVDADEWLEDISPLKEFLTGPDGKKHTMVTSIQRNYRDQAQKTYTDSFVIRMAKRMGGALRYKDPIHEVLYFTDQTAEQTIALPRFILHHDGYLYENKEDMRAKSERNMMLLRAELEKTPRDLRRLVQCVESSLDLGEREGYVRRMREILAAGEGRENPWWITAYQCCIKTYLTLGYHQQVLDCLEEAKSVAPDSFPIRLDGEGYAMQAAYLMGNYAVAAEHGLAWEAAMAGVDRGEDLQQLERFCCKLETAGGDMQSKLRAILADCLGKEGRTEEMEGVLSRIDLDNLSEADVPALLNGVLESGVGADFLGRFWDHAMALDQEGDSRGEERLQLACTWFRTRFPVGEEPKTGAQTLAALGDRAPGQSARMLLADGAEDLEAVWEQVEDWLWIFPEVYLRRMEFGQSFPVSFLCQPSEQLAAIVSTMTEAGGETMARTAMRWLSQAPTPESANELTWQLDLITGALRSHDWSEENELGSALCALYADLSDTYLDNFYNPELLNEEDICALPGMMRFAWYYRQVRAAQAQGDELGYVRALRQALKNAKGMKGMVDFLLQHPPKSAAQKQLQELAEQVRAILARYPADDPAVAALKRSEAYQRVAHLLEGQDDQPENDK